jgi:galactose oxidase
MPTAVRPRNTGSILVLIPLLITAGCREASRVGPAEAGSIPVSVTYVCGNDFDLGNQADAPLLVRYAVLGTSEAGELLLPPAEEGSESTTRLTTMHGGAVQVGYESEVLQPVANGAVACAPVKPSTPEAELGQWSPPFSWPVVAVHLHLLPSGRVLSWGRAGQPQIWDPNSGSFREVVSATMVFCSGHSYLPNGQLLVTGGHLADRRGLRDANVFDPTTETWVREPSMSYARWYPTSTTLSDGSVLTIGGTDEQETQVEVPEVWAGGSWHELEGARRELPYYPRMFTAPNGLVFYAGELQETAYLDPAGSGSWMPVARSNYGRRDYGTAVMYRPGKIMIAGGSDPPDGAPTRTAELIDLNEPTPAWRYTESMRYPRRHLNATILPDGEVLVTGGTSSPGFSNPAGAVHAPELWNSRTEQWSPMAAGQVNRVYHSTTLLLPDGRVLHSGSGDGPGLPRELSAEIFSPPYLFTGERPVLSDAPQTVGYGQSFVLASPDAGQVVRVTLIRLGSVTHAFDQNQRFVELEFRRTAGGLTVSSPASRAIAPPGHYLLAILNAAGIPSIARIVRLG